MEKHGGKYLIGEMLSSVRYGMQYTLVSFLFMQMRP